MKNLHKIMMLSLICLSNVSASEAPIDDDLFNPFQKEECHNCAVLMYKALLRKQPANEPISHHNAKQLVDKVVQDPLAKDTLKKCIYFYDGDYAALLRATADLAAQDKQNALATALTSKNAHSFEGLNIPLDEWLEQQAILFLQNAIKIRKTQIPLKADTLTSFLSIPPSEGSQSIETIIDSIAKNKKSTIEEILNKVQKREELAIDGNPDDIERIKLIYARNKNYGK